MFLRPVPHDGADPTAMIWFIAYSLLFIALAYWDYRKGQSPQAYFLNSRRSKTHQVGFSIVASCVGGSATVGMSGLAFEAGMPAMWWLLSGAVGLVLLRIFMVPRVRARAGALTMPEMIRSMMGPAAYRMASLIILIAWTAILAAQFSAMGRIVEAVTGLTTLTAMGCGAFVIVLYTWLGGQASVIKSDVIQLVVMLAGIAVLLVVLVGINPEPVKAMTVEFINESFTLSDWSRFMLLIGGSYIVCPMLFARIMSAESDKAARRGTDIGIAGIVLSAVLLTALGIEARAFVPAGTASDSVLPQLVSSLPAWAGIAFFFVMVSAILSSADSCLITAATVTANDLLGRPSVKASRTLLLLISAAAFALASTGKSVLGLLLSANTMYTCAVVAPIFVTLSFDRPLHHARAALVIAAAGSLALASELLSYVPLAYAAAAVSLVGSLLCLQGRATTQSAPVPETVPVRVK